MNRTLRLLLCLLLALACATCGPPDRHVDRDVAASEIEGVWELTPASLDALAADGHEFDRSQDHRITFRAGGELEFASIDDGFDGPQYVAATGTWTVGPSLRDRADPGAPKNAVEITLTTTSPRAGIRLGVAEESGKLRLWSFYSDPDLWQFLEYERVE